MIYMSLLEEIERCLKQGDLYLVGPFLIAAPIRRKLYVSKDMYNFLTYPSQDEMQKAKLRRLQAALDRYISGGEIAVALRYRKKPSTNIARLYPPWREVWAIRVRTSDRRLGPQLRAFGRFAGTDILVVFTCADRDDIRSEDWEAEIQHCEREWERLFYPEPPPKIGSMKIDDYISTNFIPG